MSQLVLLPVLVPLAGAILGLMARARRGLQQALSLAGAAGLLASGIALLHQVAEHGPQVAELGNWPAPFGIVLVADQLSALLITLAGAIGLASLLYATASVDPRRAGLGYHPLTLVLLAGVSGAFLTGDLFNLYVWFEVLLIASFVLVVLDGERQALTSGLNYVVVNLLSSVLFLTALGLIYGLAGTLNLADLATSLPAVGQQGLVQAAALLLLISFGIKAAIFPLFFWLPRAYTAVPVASSALFAGLMTKVGIYAMLRVFTVAFHGTLPLLQPILVWVAGITMVVGVLGALGQDRIRDILAYHSISQVGYMVMGIAIGTPLALAGAVVFILHHSVVKANLFLVGGLTEAVGGADELSQLGGLAKARPWLAALFLVPALSLAGLPPLSGFWAKLSLVQAGLETGAYVLVGVALATGLLTLLSMTKIWSSAFWRPIERPASSAAQPWALVVPAVALALLTVAGGLAIEPVLSTALEAAGQLTEPAAYLEAVLGGGP